MTDTNQHYQLPLPQDSAEAGGVILRDGSTATLRPVAPTDAPLLRAFIENVSKEARVRRFFGDVPVEVALTHLLESRPPDHLSLLVLTGEEPRVVAHGTYIRDAPQAAAAEVAFLVDDAYQGRGVGSLLLERLALVAARRGVRSFYAPTEAGNRAMRALFRSSGFPVREERDGGTVEVSFSILPNRESVTRALTRERVATVASLRPFFHPRGVAVVGASRDPESLGHRIFESLRGSSVPVYPVNDKADTVGGTRAYPSVEAVVEAAPEPLDMAVIVTPRDAVLGVVDDCGRAGVRALLVVSAGFADAGEGGRALQETLKARVRGYGMRLIGPNCLGLFNTDPALRLNASPSLPLPPPGPVALSSQSGALGLAVLSLAQALELGLSQFVSLGNKADVSSNDLLQYWEDDPATQVILLYLESFGNPRRFARLARRVGRKKPIIAVKAGRGAGDAGRSLGGGGGENVLGDGVSDGVLESRVSEDGVVEALFRQTGVIRVGGLEEMFGAAALLSSQALPEGPRVGVVTNARGPAVLAVDALRAEGLELPPPSAATRAGLETLLPAGASTENPVNLLTTAGAEAYRAAVGALLADPTFDALLVLFAPLGLADPEGVSEALRESVAAARAAGNPKPILACFGGHRGLSALSSPNERIPSYRFPEAAARALGSAHTYARWRRTPPGVVPGYPDIDVDVARAVLRRTEDKGGGWLSARETADVLRAFGLPLIEGETAADAEGAVQAAEKLGYPVAVKLESRTLLQKSAWGGVVLGLTDAAAVRAACEGIKERLEEAGRVGELEGFLIQPVVAGGLELLVSVTDDPLFGPLISFGLGGVFVELLRDVVLRVTPLTDRDAREMIRGVRGYPLLSGYRGAPPADVGALETLLLRTSRLIEEVPEIVGLELNPVKAHPPGEGCTILDAKIKVRGASA